MLVFQYCQWYYPLTVVTRSVIIISRISKLEEKIKFRPTPNDITFEEFDKFLRNKGFEQRKRNKGTSHVTYIYDHNGVKEILTFTKPHGSSDGIEEIYITKSLELIERIEIYNN